MSYKGDFFWDTLYFARGAVGKHSLRGKILGFAELQSGTIMGDKSPIILTEQKKKKIAAAAKKEMRARFEWASGVVSGHGGQPCVGQQQEP